MMVIMPSFDPATFLAALIAHRPQFLHLVPPLIGFLATHPAVTPDHLSSVTTIFGGAAPIGKTLLHLLKQKAPQVRFREVYGMTEMSPFVTGDIGYYDEQGRVFIEDRKKELIKVKGLQVAPAELTEE